MQAGPEQRSPVFGAQRNPTMVDYPGYLAALFFTAGCNFRCGFCHNSELAGAYRPGFTWERLRSVCERFREEWVDAAVVTGGEPTLAPGLVDLIDFLKDLGWRVKLDTNGSNPSVLRALADRVDYVAMDVKCSLARYPELCRFGNTDAIRESLEVIAGGPWDYEFRTTVIESIHDDHEMREVGDLIAGARRYVLKPFVPRDGLPDPDLRNEPRTSARRLEQLGELMKGYAGEVIVHGLRE